MHSSRMLTGHFGGRHSDVSTGVGVAVRGGVFVWGSQSGGISVQMDLKCRVKITLSQTSSLSRVVIIPLLKTYSNDNCANFNRSKTSHFISN